MKGSYTILIADDDNANCKRCRYWLRGVYPDANILLANTLKEAVELIFINDIDIAFLDLHYSDNRDCEEVYSTFESILDKDTKRLYISSHDCKLTDNFIYKDRSFDSRLLEYVGMEGSNSAN